LGSFEKFNFDSYEAIEHKIRELGVGIKLSSDLSPISRPVKIGSKIAPNSMAILPMEGCDSNPDGSPSDLVTRRYNRFNSGGAGLIWYEACAVVHKGKANPLHMYLNRANAGAFAALIKENCAETAKSYGSDHNPVRIIQLTHAGRYARPDHAPEPIIAYHDPLLDLRSGIDKNYPLVTDEFLDELQEDFVQSAILARDAGFDGVDIKACHRYLVSELLASHTRAGKYGGSFENRTRFLVETIRNIRKAVGDDFIIASRFNAFDAHPYPYGFGADKDDDTKPDMAEPLALTKLLVESA
jgi:2,4-dienoyl-CoA reductase (NADPH2)